MRCIIVDDEPLAIQLLTQYAERLENLAVIDTYTDPIAALAGIKKYKPDILFLDIQMPQLSGMELARLVPEGVHTIFTTAYRDYAVQGFELNARDYLVKPISFTRFIESVQRVEELHSVRAPAAVVEDVRDYIFIKHEHKHIKLNLSEILYLKGQGDYVEIKTKDKRWMTLERLKDFESKLPIERFMRVHKSYIIHVDKIESIEKSRVKIGEELIAISPVYREEFKDRFLGEH